MESKNIKILTIDDNQDNLISLKALLNEAFPNATILTALNGTKGIELASTEDPNVILLDILMPDMDGYEVCEKLKSNKSTKHIPIVMLTAIQTDAKSRIKGLNLGAEAFLSKPIDACELAAQVRVMLRMVEAENILRKEKFLLEDIVLDQTEELKKSEERLSSVFKAMSEGFSIQEVICDEEGKPIDLRFIDANPAFESQTGLKNSETLGHTLLELFPSSETYWIERYGHVGLTGEPTTFEAKFGPLDKHYHCNAFQIKPGFFGTMFTDINDRIIAENQIKESEDKFRGIYDQSPIAIEIYDKEGKLIDVNQQTMDMFGIDDKKYVLGFDLWSDPNLKGEKTDRLKNGQEIFISTEFDFELVKKKKLYPTSRSGVMYMDMYAIPLLRENELTGFLIHILEVTERKLAEDEMKKSERNFKALFENSPDLVALTDMNGTFIDINRVASGYTKDQVIGTKVTDFLSPEQINEFNNAVEECIKTGVTQSYMPVITNPDGQQIYYHNRVSLFKHSELEDQLVINFTDVTERKQADEEIRKQLDELQRWHAVTLGREGRVLELKREVNELLKQRGEPLRYESTNSDEE